MGRPEILTSATLALAGLVLALWLSASRVPPTPAPPGAPEMADGQLALAIPPARDLPRMEASAVPPEPALGWNGLPCGPSLHVEPAEAGLLRVAVHAPCHAGEVVEVTYGPLNFAERLSVRGTLQARVPRLARGANISARVEGTLLEAEAPVKGHIAEVSGLVWSSPLALSLAAFEFGAGPGGPGHLTAGSGNGAGRVLRLGDPALGPVTELYVGPETAGPGVVRLHVMARPTAAGCTGEQPLTAFRSGPRTLTVRDIRLRLGPCDGTSEIILLKNLLEDLKIAGR